MCYNKLTMLTPCVLLLNACITVTPAYEDNGPCASSCVQGGSDSVVQQFYDYHIQRHDSDIIILCLYLSDELVTLLSDTSRDNSRRKLLSSDPFSSRTTLPDSVHVASASTIPNRGTHNIPLCMDLRQGDQGWQDEVSVIQEGQYWVIDNVRYSGGSVHTTAGMFRQPVEDH